MWFFAGGLLVAWLPSWAPLTALRPAQGGAGGDAAQQAQTRSIMQPSGGTADSNGRMIAVTGTDLTGASILYLVDTENEQLVIYQASGGSSSGQGVELIGARRISLDLMLDGFNDKSDYSYKDLRKQFETRDLLPEGAGGDSRASKR